MRPPLLPTREGHRGLVEPGSACSHLWPSHLTFQLFASLDLGLTISFRCADFHFTRFHIGDVTLTLLTPFLSLIFSQASFLSKTRIMSTSRVCFEIYLAALEDASAVCLLTQLSSLSLP